MRGSGTTPHPIATAVVAGALAGAAVVGMLRAPGMMVIGVLYGSTGRTVGGVAVLLVAVLMAIVAAFLVRRRAARRWVVAAVATVVVGLVASSRLGGPKHGGPPARFGSLVVHSPSITRTESFVHRAAVRFDVNEHGFRGPSFHYSRRAGVDRVVLVGDSFVEGHGLEWRDTLGVRLGEELARRRPERRVEVINLGLGGDNLPSHVTMIEEATRRLAPDVVVLGVTLVNDLSSSDDQALRRAELESPLMRVAEALFDDPVVVWAMTVRTQATELDARALAVLDTQCARLDALEAAGGPTVIVLPYHPRSAVETRMRRVRGLGWVTPPPDRAELWIPRDGHPTAAANRAFAAALAPSVLEALSRR